MVLNDFKSDKDETGVLFRESVIIDVTDFEVIAPGEDCGYACGGIISVSSEGKIEIVSDQMKCLKVF